MHWTRFRERKTIYGFDSKSYLEDGMPVYSVSYYTSAQDPSKCCVLAEACTVNTDFRFDHYFKVVATKEQAHHLAKLVRQRVRKAYQRWLKENSSEG